LFALLSLLLWIKHHENIGRLIKGRESKIGQKTGQPTSPSGSP